MNNPFTSLNDPLVHAAAIALESPENREFLSEAIDKSKFPQDEAALIKALEKALPKNDTQKYGDQISWSKRGGYAGEKMSKTILEKLKAIGFKPASVSGSNTPDGSNVGFRQLFSHKLGWTAAFRQNYGSTASSNSFSVTIKKDA